MRCPNCEELLKDDAKVCFSCGQDLKDYVIDNLIQEMIDEDNENSKKKQIDSTKSTKSGSKSTPKSTFLGEKKNNKKNMNNTTSQNAKYVASPLKGKLNSVSDSDGTQSELDSKGKVIYGQAFRITAIVTMISIAVMLISLFMGWFALSGRGAYIGFVDDGSKTYKTKEISTLAVDQILLSDESLILLEFSPKGLFDYSKMTDTVYNNIQDVNGQAKKHWTIIIQQIYIKGLLLLPIMGLLSMLFLVIDRRFYIIEFVRGLSLISILIILLNFLVLKVPFFSMFAIRGKSLLQIGNTLNRVTMNLNGINLNNEFYPYKLVEKPGFYVALVSCFLWFVLTTVLIEMKKDKNKQYG